MFFFRIDQVSGSFPSFPFDSLLILVLTTGNPSIFIKYNASFFLCQVSKTRIRQYGIRRKTGCFPGNTLAPPRINGIIVSYLSLFGKSIFILVKEISEVTPAIKTVCGYESSIHPCNIYTNRISNISSVVAFNSAVTSARILSPRYTSLAQR